MKCVALDVKEYSEFKRSDSVKTLRYCSSDTQPNTLTAIEAFLHVARINISHKLQLGNKQAR